MITEPRPTPPVVAILGAGPAGMSCANACLSFGLRPLVIERSDQAGGVQRRNFHPNLWMLGWPEETGESLTRRMVEHYASLPIETRYQTELLGAQRGESVFRLSLAESGGERETIQADAIVLATGMHPYATPELEDLARRSPRVIIGPLSHTIRDGIQDADVLILGGGDNALDHALFLAERRNRVRVHTRGTFAARATFRTACAGREDIRLVENSTPLRLSAGQEGILAAWPGEELRFDWLLVMYGYRPNIELLDRFSPSLRPDLTAGGHVHVDDWQRTSTPGVYAAGDLTAPAQPSVPTAIAQGLAAARAIERDITWRR
ncbi:MAG: NAD(P)/FAD-dependent oxidoreductase [Pseudomonadota bacterium]